MVNGSIPAYGKQVVYDERRIELAASFLDGNDYAIHKTTRAGFTTSFVIAAERSNKRGLLLSPTKKIISSTMKDAAEIVGIYGNSACEYNKRAIDRHPLLRHLPMSLPPMEKCEVCKYADECCIMDIERDPDAPLKSITIAKLTAIMLSDGERSDFLREVLRDQEFMLIDEAHSLIVGDVPKVPCDITVYTSLILKLQAFPTLQYALRVWKKLLNEISPFDDYNVYDDLEQEAEACGTDRWLIREVQVPARISSGYQRKMFGELRKMARHNEESGITEQDIILLRDLIDILTNDRVRLSYITTKGIGKIYVCGSIGRQNGAIKNYLRDYARNAVVIFVSGTLYEPNPNYFRDLVGREKIMNVVEPQVEQVVFPDICDTNSKMTIYADTTRLSGKTEHKLSKLPDFKKRIKEISEFKQNAPIHLFAPNKDIKIKLSYAMHKDYPNIFFDYYRSPDTIGIESSNRIIIAIGLAEVPKNAYDCLSDSYTESQTIRVNDVHAWTWQAWSRGKDPAGIEPSEVYCIGVKSDEAIKVVTWGTNRRISIGSKNEYNLSCDEELPKPTVMFPFKQQEHKEQRKPSPFIKKIWDVENDEWNLPDGLEVYDVEISDQKYSKNTLVYIRDFGENGDSSAKKVRCFGALFSQPQNLGQLEITAKTLDRFFRSNRSQHAVQNKWKNSQGTFGYKPFETGDWEQLVLDIVCGTVAVATYSIGDDGQTVQCAFDIDNHNGDTPSLPRVAATIEHLRQLGIEPILEASGSADSYHIHIPIMKTPIATSHNFVDAFRNEMMHDYRDLNFKGMETFPKQKKSPNQKNKGKKLGNALRLPLSINWKTGNRSQLLDPSTKEPVDVILITKVLELREPEEEAIKINERQYLPAVLPSRRKRNLGSGERAGTMRPCIFAALEKQLVGGEGHDMHIAIVREAYAAGMSRDEIIHLFEGQDNFNERITGNHVDALLQDIYPPWKCETLQDKCSSLVDCENCPLRRIASENMIESATAR